MRYAALAGLFDGLGLLGSVLIILACVILVGALATWIISDAQVTFATIFESIDKAIIVPASSPAPLP